jgi:hypothetical protein
MRFKAIWPTAPRDFLICTTWSYLDENPDSGVIMVSSRSAWDELCPTDIKQGKAANILLV